MRLRRHEDASIAHYLDACERGKLRKARRIYSTFDDATQRQADRLLAEQNLYHLKQAELAQDAADLYGRAIALLEEHGAKTLDELPPDIMAQLMRDAEALDAREQSDAQEP
jgi:hypothetical protein